MSYLAIQQQALLNALFAWPATASIAIDLGAFCANSSVLRGFKVYQNSDHILAQKTLAVAYPVVAQLLGYESFAYLVRANWHPHPPVHGDVARAEWALHQSASAAHAQADLSTLALLTTQDPAALCLALAPGCAVLQSVWPVASLLSAHLHPNLSQTPSFATAGQQLRDAVAQDVIVWRAGLRPRVREAVPGEAAFVAELLLGRPLAQALDTAVALDFSTWLPAAIQSGLVLYITQISL